MYLILSSCSECDVDGCVGCVAGAVVWLVDACVSCVAGAVVGLVDGAVWY